MLTKKQVQSSNIWWPAWSRVGPPVLCVHIAGEECMWLISVIPSVYRTR